MAESKRCTQCGEEKPLEDFRLTSKRAAGGRYRASDCGDCHRKASAKYRADHLEERRAAELAYSRQHAAQKRENASRWYQEHGERARRRSREAYARDPEYNRDKAHQSRAKKAGAPIIEFVRRREVYERDEGICHVCGETITWDDYDMDHVVPLTAGGAHTYENVKASHSACNRARRVA